MTYSQPLCSMSISPPILRCSYFKIWAWKSLANTMHMVKGLGHIWPWKFKDQGKCQGQTWWSHLRSKVQSIRLLCVSWQSDHFGLSYSKLHILPWKIKVKVMAKVNPDGHFWGLELNRYVFFFVSWQSDHFGLRYSKFHIWPWKFKIKVMAKVKLDGHIWGPAFNRYVCFLFRGNRTMFGWDIANSILTLKIQGQGHDENRPKSNQVIYRPWPMISVSKNNKLFCTYYEYKQPMNV